MKNCWLKVPKDIKWALLDQANGLSSPAFCFPKWIPNCLFPHSGPPKRHLAHYCSLAMGFWGSRWHAAITTSSLWWSCPCWICPESSFKAIQTCGILSQWIRPNHMLAEEDLLLFILNVPNISFIGWLLTGLEGPWSNTILYLRQPNLFQTSPPRCSGTSMGYAASYGESCTAGGLLSIAAQWGDLDLCLLNSWHTSAFSHVSGLGHWRQGDRIRCALCHQFHHLLGLIHPPSSVAFTHPVASWDK